MKKPNRVTRCTTHHHACDCHQWRYEQLEEALKIIHTWASVDERPEFQHNAVRSLGLIKKKSLDALNCLKGKDGEMA